MGFLDGLKKGVTQGLVAQLYKKVESGDKDAMAKLGTMLLKGENVEANPTEAYRILKMGADLGEPVALNNVGACFEYGAGVEKNLDSALQYYQKAAAAGYEQGKKNANRVQQILDQDPTRSLTSKAENGDIEAQAELGVRYTKGIDVEQNHQLAIKWLTPAAQANHLGAQFYLGRLYAEEMNLPSEGLTWLEKASDSGYADAQAKMGIYYATGKCVEKDLEKAVVFFRQAALQGHKEAANNLALAEKKIVAPKQPVTPQHSQNASSDINCPQCGVALQPSSKFCGSCGSKLELEKFCTSCGAKIDRSAKFCGECGAGASSEKTEEQSSKSTQQITNVMFDNELEGSFDFVNKAEELLAEGQKELAVAHIQRALELAEDGGDLSTIATFVCKSNESEGLNDKEWGKELYQQAEAEINDAFGLARLALSIADADSLGDETWAKEIYKKAASAASNCNELVFVAKSSLDIAGQKVWALSLMEKATATATDSDEFQLCGKTFGECFDDKVKAREVFERAVDLASDPQTLMSAAEAILYPDYLGDSNWASELLNKVEEMINNGESDPDDEDWLREQLQDNRSALDDVPPLSLEDTVANSAMKGTDSFVASKLSLFNGIDPDLLSVVNLKIGYTQGELNATEGTDYVDGFKAENHVYWKYTIVKDQGGDTGCDWLLIDWSNPLNSRCLSGDEEAAETIGELIEPSTEDMFGTTIPAVCFQSIVQSILDEPDGYEFIEETLEKIGGSIEVEDGDKIDESLVNSLFALSIELDSSAISVKEGNLYVNGQLLEIDNIDEAFIAEIKHAAFTEDVMGY